MPAPPSRRFLLAAMLMQPVQPRRAWSGTWEASASGRAIGGTWTARDYGDDEESGGRWTLMLQPGRVLLEGTWNARKRRRGWDGSWVARVLKGGRYEGTWSARIRLPAEMPLAEMFELARTRPVSGRWSDSAGRSGTWMIRAD